MSDSNCNIKKVLISFVILSIILISLLSLCNKSKDCVMDADSCKNFLNENRMYIERPLNIEVNNGRGDFLMNIIYDYEEETLSIVDKLGIEMDIMDGGKFLVESNEYFNECSTDCFVREINWHEFNPRGDK